MSPSITSVVDLISILSGVGAAFLLYRASEGLPWSQQTYDGETGPEKTHDQRQKRNAKCGLVLLGLAFFLQLVLWGLGQVQGY